MMKSRIFVGAFAVSALLLGGVLAADGLVSGPQVGKKIPGPFNVKDVSKNVGKSYCQV
jgi:hypothetical protein